MLLITETVKRSAGRKVLLIPELTAMILASLPLRDAIIAERVCKTWQRTLRDMPELRSKLAFASDFSPDEPFEGVAFRNAENEVAQLNPLLRLEQHPLDSGIVAPGGVFLVEGLSEMIHALDHDHAVILEYIPRENEISLTIPYHGEGAKHLHNISKGVPGSVSRMFITRPPLPIEINVSCRFRLSQGKISRIFVRRYIGWTVSGRFLGGTIGDLLQDIEALTRRLGTNQRAGVVENIAIAHFDARTRQRLIDIPTRAGAVWEEVGRVAAAWRQIAHELRRRLLGRP